MKASRRRKVRKAKQTDCDRLFSQLIRERDGWACRACGSIHRPQCAHIVSRRYRAVRWNTQNAVCLCSACHTRWTYNPLAWEAWVEERFPGRLEELKRSALAGVRWIDYETILASLKEQVKVLGK